MSSSPPPKGPAGEGEGGEKAPALQSPRPQEPQQDRIAEIMAYLNDPTLDTLPDHLRTFKYTEGFDPDKLEEELQTHPFFMTELPDPSKPLPPLLEAFQQLKYSEVENSNHELAVNHKEDGMFHFKIKKYRIAATCFTNAISYELKYGEDVDKELVANLYNNRSACSWFIANYRSCIKDCEEALKYKPGYIKVLRRAVLSAEKLEQWGEVEKYCKLGTETCEPGDVDGQKFYLEKRGIARRGKVTEEVKERRRKLAGERKEFEDTFVLDVVKARGVKARDWGFMTSEAALEGKVVKFADDDNAVKKLLWPVLFMYPQFNESDFIEAFEEDDSISVQLYEILDNNRPGWDTENEYKLETARVYYLGDKLVRVDVNMSLQNVLKQDWFTLPYNGVPTFFVLCDNQFSRDFIERVEVL